MVVGDKVKFKYEDEWREGIIVNLYALPEEYCLVDIELETGKVVYGIDSRDVYGV